MLIKERNFSVNDGYRFGFNGKENDNELYGGGNALDFGDRIYDSRICRWLSVDPVQKKYPDWSPYSYCMNSPLKLKDKDGKDVEVTIDDHSITFSSTVYVTGPGAGNIAADANKTFEEFSKSALQNRTYTDVNGKVYEIKMKICFVAIDNVNNTNDPNLTAYNAVRNATPETNGNNIIEITTDPIRANAANPAGENYASGNVREDFISGNGMVQTRNVKKSGNMVKMSSSDKGRTSIHEILHNFGLGDRYTDNVEYSVTCGNDPQELINCSSMPQIGYENDIMSTGFEFNQTHINNLASVALSLQASTNNNNFVMGRKVDNANNADKDAAVQSMTSGNCTYEKKENK